MSESVQDHAGKDNQKKSDALDLNGTSTCKKTYLSKDVPSTSEVLNSICTVNNQISKELHSYAIIQDDKSRDALCSSNSHLSSPLQNTLSKKVTELQHKFKSQTCNSDSSPNDINVSRLFELLEVDFSQSNSFLSLYQKMSEQFPDLSYHKLLKNNPEIFRNLDIDVSLLDYCDFELSTETKAKLLVATQLFRKQVTSEKLDQTTNSHLIKNQEVINY